MKRRTPYLTRLRGSPRYGCWRLWKRAGSAKSSAFICNQLKDPERNGNRTIREVAAHLDHDSVLHWAFNPGGNREPAPHSLQEAMDALMNWAAAGTPCPPED